MLGVQLAGRAHGRRRCRLVALRQFCVHALEVLASRVEVGHPLLQARRGALQLVGLGELIARGLQLLCNAQQRELDEPCACGRPTEAHTHARMTPPACSLPFAKRRWRTLIGSPQATQYGPATRPSTACSDTWHRRGGVAAPSTRPSMSNATRATLGRPSLRQLSDVRCGEKHKLGGAGV